MSRPARRFPLVIFDLDGTLVDSFADIHTGILLACAAVELVPGAEVLALTRRGAPLEEFYGLATGAAPDDLDRHPEHSIRFARFAAAYREHYLPGCVSTTLPYPGVLDGLARLHALPDRPLLGVATTKRTETARRVVEGTGLAPFLDMVCGSDGLVPKPDPAVLRKVAAATGVPVERALMVGDTDRDLGAARAAGCASCAVGWGGFHADELRALAPDYLVSSFAELCAIVVAAPPS